jgi:hypothetical protein
MNAVLEQRAHGIRAELHYLAAAQRALHSYATSPPDGVPESNAAFAAHTVDILDARYRPRPLSLAANGAELVSHRSGVRRFYAETEVSRRYYPEAAEVIRAATRAREVIVFDHNVRRAGAAERSDAYSPQQPVFHVHTDFTAHSARRRAESVLGRPLVPGQRIAAINLWRPIAGPLRDSPLAVCDASSVASRDLVPVELRYPDRIGQIYYVGYNPAHCWYYAPDMRTDEVWIFKNYDSGDTAVPRFTPHSAFADPTAHHHVVPRESIEVRAFALFDG